MIIIEGNSKIKKCDDTESFDLKKFFAGIYFEEFKEGDKRTYEVYSEFNTIMDFKNKGKFNDHVWVRVKQLTKYFGYKEYFEKHVKFNIVPNTYGYRIIIDEFFDPEIGHVKINRKKSEQNESIFIKKEKLKLKNN